MAPSVMNTCPTHGEFTGSSCPQCGWRRPAEAEGGPAPTLCQRCTAGREAVAVTDGAYVCENCYEEFRPRTWQDKRRAEIMASHPEWQRQPGESSYDYGRRRAKIGRELAARSGMRKIREAGGDV